MKISSEKELKILIGSKIHLLRWYYLEGQRYSREQSTNIPDLSEMQPRIGYKTALSGGKKLPDNQVVMGVMVEMVIHGMQITKMMRMSSLGEIFKTTLKRGLGIRNTVKINLKKINNVI